MIPNFFAYTLQHANSPSLQDLPGMKPIFR